MPHDAITIQISDKSVLKALERVRLAGVQPSTMLKEIGEDLMSSTKARFLASTAPDGSKWEPNSPVTVSRYLAGRSGMLTQKGSLTKKANGLMANKKPLIGRSKQLSRSIDYDVRKALLLVGSTVKDYAGTQQFGAKRGEFGTTTRGGNIPFGDIPARPFLGMSSADTASALRVVEKYLRRAL